MNHDQRVAKMVDAMVEAVSAELKDLDDAEFIRLRVMDALDDEIKRQVRLLLEDSTVNDFLRRTVEAEIAKVEDDDETRKRLRSEAGATVRDAISFALDVWRSGLPKWEGDGRRWVYDQERKALVKVLLPEVEGGEVVKRGGHWIYDKNVGDVRLATGRASDKNGEE